jgi:hypothetical protein
MVKHISIVSDFPEFEGDANRAIISGCGIAAKPLPAYDFHFAARAFCRRRLLRECGL